MVTILNAYSKINNYAYNEKRSQKVLKEEKIMRENGNASEEQLDKIYEASDLNREINITEYEKIQPVEKTGFYVRLLYRLLTEKSFSDLLRSDFITGGRREFFTCGAGLLVENIGVPRFNKAGCQMVFVEYKHPVNRGVFNSVVRGKHNPRGDVAPSILREVLQDRDF